MRLVVVPAVLVVGLAAVLTTLAGCSGDNGEALPAASVLTAADPSNPACDAATVIASYDDTVESQLQTAISDAVATGDMNPISERFRELTDQGTIDAVLGAYDDLAATVPEGLAAQAVSLRDFTAGFFAQVQGAASVDALTTYLEGIAADPAALDAGTATVALDEFLRPTCGIAFAD